MKHSVEVLIPVFNGKAFIRDAIESALMQEGCELRVRVFDNCSSDGTASFIEETYRGNSRVRLSVNGQNLGLIGNLNMCLNSADADYYCILCADDYLNDSRAASDALDALESDATLAAVYSDLLYVDAKRHLLFQRSFNRRGSFDVKRTVMPCVLHTRNMFGIPVLVRREMMAGILYDPQLAYAGDADVAFQLGNRGGAYHIDRPLIANRYHGGNSSRSLHWQAYAEYRKIITKHGLQLSPWDEVAMRMLSFKTLAAKTFFFWLLDLKVARIRK